LCVVARVKPFVILYINFSFIEKNVFLQDYDLQKSVNFFDRQSLAKFDDLFA